MTSRSGHPEAAWILLEHGMDMKIREKYDWNPSERALENGQVDVDRELLENGANAMVRGSTGTTPLHTPSGYG